MGLGAACKDIVTANVTSLLLRCCTSLNGMYQWSYNVLVQQCDAIYLGLSERLALTHFICKELPVCRDHFAVLPLHDDANRRALMEQRSLAVSASCHAACMLHPRCCCTANSPACTSAAISSARRCVVASLRTMSSSSASLCIRNRLIWTACLQAVRGVCSVSA